MHPPERPYVGPVSGHPFLVMKQAVSDALQVSTAGTVHVQR